MTDSCQFNRRLFLGGVALMATGADAAETLASAVAAAPAALEVADASPRPNMVGAYGPWLADEVLGDAPGRLSFRTGKFPGVEAWRQEARARAWQSIAPVNLGGTPEVRVDARSVYDCLAIEHLSWQLPCGPRTEAVYMKPAGAQGPLPAILALHDHGGNKFLGWRKIARTDD